MSFTPSIAALVLSTLIMGSALAQGRSSPPGGPPSCVPPARCEPATARRLSFPAEALSYGSPSTAFVAETRGMRWQSDAGTATLTIRRPIDYAGGEVRFSVFYEVLDDSSGDIAFGITPVSFNHGSSFETYGGELTNVLDAPESTTILFQQTATFAAGEPGYQWPPTGEWWYFEIRRGGSFVGPIRLMAVSIDY